MAAAFPDIVVQPGSEAYTSSNKYWSVQQSQVHPYCFVRPETTDQVAKVVQKLVRLRMKFSVKGGGHVAFAGGSNAEDGATIDLVNLKNIEVAPDRKTVTVGAGTKWIEIAQVLDPLKLAVVGGRAADVGVAGLTLGGGLSYFAERYGLACDNVREFEVVLSDGRIVKANKDDHSDLFWALRGGGGSNFGVVTKFQLEAFDQGELWAQTIIFPGSANVTLLDKYAHYVTDVLPTDKDAHSYFVVGYTGQLGGYFTLSSFFHASLPPKDAIPPVFAEFQDIPGALLNTTGASNVSALARAIDEPYGMLQTWAVTSIYLRDPSLFKQIVAKWKPKIDQLVDKDATLTPFVVFQPFSENLLAATKNNGGNSLGLGDEPFTLVQFPVMWSNPDISDAVYKLIEDMIKEVGQMAEARNTNKGWVYMNYAAEFQDVLKSYGQEAYDGLKMVSEKYDPHRCLQRFWRGYFQL